MENKQTELEVTDDNRLAVIVRDSDLDSTKAAILLENFKDYFQIAKEWEVKARAIVVTDVGQKTEMEMARVGRLFLREKRIAIEKTRKELKEQSLREGKAIDGIANVLKAVIVPIEEYLNSQEKFAEIKAKEEADRIRAEMEAKAEQERIAREEAERAEQQRIREENERLRKEAEAAEAIRVAREKEIEKERIKIEQEKAAREKEIEDERRRIAEEREAEKAAQHEAFLESEARIKAISDKAKAEVIAAAKKAEDEKRQREELEAAKVAAEIECPFCHKRFVPK